MKTHLSSQYNPRFFITDFHIFYIPIQYEKEKRRCPQLLLVIAVASL